MDADGCKRRWQSAVKKVIGRDSRYPGCEGCLMVVSLKAAELLTLTLGNGAGNNPEEIGVRGMNALARTDWPDYFGVFTVAVLE